MLKAYSYIQYIITIWIFIIISTITMTLILVMQNDIKGVYTYFFSADFNIPKLLSCGFCKIPLFFSAFLHWLISSLNVKGSSLCRSLKYIRIIINWCMVTLQQCVDSSRCKAVGLRKCYTPTEMTFLTQWVGGSKLRVNLLRKYTNPAYGHSWLLQAKVVGPSLGVNNEPCSIWQTVWWWLRTLGTFSCDATYVWQSRHNICTHHLFESRHWVSIVCSN